MLLKKISNTPEKLLTILFKSEKSKKYPEEGRTVEDDPASIGLKQLLYEAKDIIKRQNEIWFFIKENERKCRIVFCSPRSPRPLGQYAH